MKKSLNMYYKFEGNYIKVKTMQHEIHRQCTMLQHRPKLINSIYPHFLLKIFKQCTSSYIHYSVHLLDGLLKIFKQCSYIFIIQFIYWRRNGFSTLPEEKKVIPYSIVLFSGLLDLLKPDILW